MESIGFETADLEILYNTYGKFIHFCGTKTKSDGNVIYYELDTGEELSFESYAINGYKKVKNKGIILNLLKPYYTFEELRAIEDEHDGLNSPGRSSVLPDEVLEDLGLVQDEIVFNRYNYDLLVPVEQIEIRYSEELGDFLFLYVTFDRQNKKLSYMNMENGLVVDKEVLSLYTLFPRDDIFDQPSYSANDIIKLKKALKSGKRLQKRR